MIGSALSQAAGAFASVDKTTKGERMNVNGVTLTGNIKNVTKRGTTDSIVTANLSQRDEDGKCITTMPLVFINNGDSALGLQADTEVQIIGRLVTRFDRRPGINNADRFKPFTQIQVLNLEVVA